MVNEMEVSYCLVLGNVNRMIREGFSNRKLLHVKILEALEVT